MGGWRVRASLALNFVVFAILLNTVGIVIKRVIDDYAVSEAVASSLEAFKDLSIAAASFLFASYLPRLGYRRSMLGGLLAVGLASVLVATVPAFWIVPALYMTIGISFAMMKGAVYATVGLITAGQKEHTSLMNVLEGIFQVGALVGPLFFSFALSTGANWRVTYWVIAALALLAFLLLFVTPLDESEVGSHPEQAGFVEMLKLLRLPMVWVFVLCAWLYVMIEQSVGTWLPTFHERVFGLAPATAAGLLSLYAGSIAASRFVMGYLTRRLPWLPIQFTLLMGGFALLFAVLVATRSNGAPAVAATSIPEPGAAVLLPRLFHRADLPNDRVDRPEPAAEAAPRGHGRTHHRVLRPGWHHGLVRRGLHVTKLQHARRVLLPAHSHEPAGAAAHPVQAAIRTPRRGDGVDGRLSTRFR